MTVTRIEPKSKLSIFEWKEILEFRDLLYFLALRDIQLRYKQTALGIVWVILQPLVPAVIFAVLFGNFAKLPSNGQPYLLLVFCGLIPWSIFSSSLGRAGGSLVGNSNLLSKVYFPRIIVPIASLGSVVVDALVSLGVLVVLLIVFQIPPGWHLLAAPLFLAAAFVIGLGASLIASSLSVYYRDFSFIVPFALQAWNYVSPVAYSAELIPEKWRWLYGLNPAAGFIEGFRWSILGSSALSNEMIFSMCVSCVAVLMAGFVVFRRIERGFADIL
jgi:lipopolysaccharide transport system permease protein